MQKQTLISFIEKYNLGGNINSVIWEFAGDKLSTNLQSDDKIVAGEISMTIPELKDFAGNKLGIFNTANLLKLLAPATEEINASLSKVGDKPIAINMIDKSSLKIHFALSDLAVIKNPSKLKYMPQEFDIHIKINKEFTDTFIKSKNAIQDATSFAIHTTAKDATIVIGQTDVNVDNIIIPLETEKHSKIDDISFNAELFKQALIANKNVDAILKVSQEGIAVLEYSGENYTAKYFFIAREKK